MRLLPLLTCLLLPVLAHAETSNPQAPSTITSLHLKDGDRFIFIGDSITHQCLYTQFVENYFYNRYPNTRLHFRNAGISGDRARDALNRFDEDIAAFKPTVATILLGMNDGSYKDFDKTVFDTYARDMQELMDKLDAIQCRVVLMSPTMFDHQAWDRRIKEKPDYARGRVVTGYNAVLAYYGKWLQQTALERGYRFVDLFGPLNDMTVRQRQIDPGFTLIADAIHPGADGHYLMALSLLEQLGETPAPAIILPSQSPTLLGTPVRPGESTLNTATDLATRTIELNKKRNLEALQPLRNLWSRQKAMLGKKNATPKPEDPTLGPEAYTAWRREFEAKRAELDALADKYEEEIYQIRKPAVAPLPQPAPAPKPEIKAAEPAKKAA